MTPQLRPRSGWRAQAERAEREREESPGLAASLLALPGRSRTASAVGNSRFAKAGVVSYLLHRAVEQQAGDPQESEELAGLALTICDRLELRSYPAEVVHDLRGRGWVVVAEARIRRGRSRAAEVALATAACYLASGTGDSLEAAAWCAAMADLAHAETRPRSSVAWGLEAARLYRLVGNGESARAIEQLIERRYSVRCFESAVAVARAPRSSPVTGEDGHA